VLIGRAPVRISFGGGGTDLPAYYEQHGGFVVNASIDKYVYGVVTHNSSAGFQMISADYQLVYLDHRNGDSRAPREIPSDPLDLPRAVIRHFGPELPINVFTASEVPPGTGLGSSGAAAVNLINLFATLTDHPLSRAELAETAYHVEAVELCAPVGKQDQYASAFGGVNCLSFTRDGVQVEPLRLPPAGLRELERRLLLFFTGNSRQAWAILRQQRDSTARAEGPVIEALHAIKALAHQIRQAIENGDFDRFGALLHASWQRKRQLARGISTSAIDQAYAVARAHGATGGKITGAGGGGFLLLDCPLVHQECVRQALQGLGLHELQFSFESQGAQVLLNTSSRELVSIGSHS